MCESLWITICLLTTVFFGSRVRSRCQSQPVVAPACCRPGTLPSVHESASQAPATPSPSRARIWFRRALRWLKPRLRAYAHSGGSAEIRAHRGPVARRPGASGRRSRRWPASQATPAPSPRPVHESGSGVHSAGSSRGYVYMHTAAAQRRFVPIGGVVRTSRRLVRTRGVACANRRLVLIRRACRTHPPHTRNGRPPKGAAARNSPALLSDPYPRTQSPSSPHPTRTPCVQP